MSVPAGAAASVSEAHLHAARERLVGLATPAGALGRLGEVGVWLAGRQHRCPPLPPDPVRAVVLAGDHGVAEHGASAYPPSVTAAMVGQVHRGRAGASVLARRQGVALRVVDVCVAGDPAGRPPETAVHRLAGANAPIHLRDAAPVDLTRRALALGAALADEDVDAGARLLVAGDLGIGNTTAAAALLAAATGRDAHEITGPGAGLDATGLRRKRELVTRALDRAAGRLADPVERLSAVGGLDLAAHAGYQAQAARRGVPVLLDGVVSVACATVAAELVPGSTDWFLAGHRSPEPGASAGLAHLGLEPLLDLGMRLGEGSGALAALPLLGAAADLLGGVAPLAEVVGG